MLLFWGWGWTRAPGLLEPPHSAHLQSVPPPIQFPGCVPNSVVLQQMWLSTELPRLPTLWKIPFHLQRQARGWGRGGVLSSAQQAPHGHRPICLQIRTWGRVWPSLKRWLWRRKLVLYGDEEEEEEEQRMSYDFRSEDGQSLLQDGEELQVSAFLLASVAAQRQESSWVHPSALPP